MSSSISYTSVSSNVAQTGSSRKFGNKTLAQVLPAHQVGSKIFLPTVRQLASTYPNSIFASAGKKSSQIPDIDYIKHLSLKVDIQVTGAPVTLVPTQYWFTQIDLRSTADGSIIQTHYDDSAMITAQARCSQGRQRSLFKSSLNMEHAETGKFGLAKALPVGTHSFHIPILTSVFENFNGLFLADLEGHLSLDLTTPASIIASGAGAISSTISFSVEGAMLSEADAKIHRDRHRMYANECQYLQAHQAIYPNTNMQAGSVVRLPMNTQDGLCAFQAVMVRPTGSKDINTNFSQFKLYNVGDNNGSSLDLCTSSGASLLGNGSPIPTKFIRHNQSIDHFDNDFFSRKPVYLVSYCDSINAALSGKINGGYKFHSTRNDELRISVPALVNENQTIQFFAAASAGRYRFVFRGEPSAWLQYNANTAAMKAVFEAMVEPTARNLKVVFSNAVSANGTVIVAFDDPEGTLDGDLVTVEEDGLDSNYQGTTRTVPGVQGLISGQYDVFVYSYFYRNASYFNNKLRSDLLLC